MSARTRTACANCGRKKMRCNNGGDDRPCQRCVENRLDCVYPPPRAQPASGSQNNCKTACDGCRKDKLRCWIAQGQDADRRCAYCREKGIECIFSASDEEQAHDDSPEPVAGPSNYPGALTVDRPVLTVDPTAGVNGPPSSTSVSPVTRANSEGSRSSTSPVGRPNSPSRGNWREVCLAPSPDAETYEERLYNAYATED